MKALTKNCFLAYLCLFGSNLYGNQLEVAGTPPAGAVGDTVSLQVKELKVGEQVPDLLVKNVINHPEGEIQLSDYRGKLLILDFWATWCAPCVKGFPKMDSLQREFEGQLEILPVTYQDQEEVDKLFSRLKVLKDIEMPMAVSDNTLRQLFPHRTLPHYVWIDPEGKVMAFTSKESVVRDSIKQVLEGVKELESKAAPKALFNRDELLFFGNRGFDEDKRILLQSVFMPYIEGMPAMYKVTGESDKSWMRIFLTNSDLPTYFGLAYGAGKVDFNRNRRILEVEEPDLLKYNADLDNYDEWKLDHRFCYELILSPQYHGQEYDIMKTDLERMFPEYRAAVEMRETEVLALVRTDNSIDLRTNGGERKIEMDAFGLELNNERIGLLPYHWRYHLQLMRIPIVDDTGIDYKVDIKLEGKMNDLESIRKTLAPYGLDLVKKVMPIKMLVIRDRPQGH